MTQLDRLENPEEIVFERCYSPAPIEQMLASAETRSKIRRLPAPQLFFSLLGAEDACVARLLPHVTEEQWRGILDLDLWSRDEADLGKMVRWQRHLLLADDAVAKKLIRAIEPELWQLFFRRKLEIYRRLDSEGEFAVPPEQAEWFETPDAGYRILFPTDPEEARVLQALVERLHALEPEQTNLMFEQSLVRTSLELEEISYQNRKNRMHDLGFQDYFDAIEVYTPIEAGVSLPEKHWQPLRVLSLVPARIPSRARVSLLLFEAINRLEYPQEIEALQEELFFVSNKVLSADRIPPGSAEGLKRGIRKAVSGINLGLDWWSDSQLPKAVDGLRRHYLQSFFQLGYTRLSELKKRAQGILSSSPAEPGSYEEEVLEGLVEAYPSRVVRTEKGTQRDFFMSLDQLRSCQALLARISRTGS